jgi:hypothetical protein
MDRKTEWRRSNEVKKDDGRRYVEEEEEAEKVDQYYQ